MGGARVPSDRLTPGAFGYACPPLTMGTVVAGGGGGGEAQSSVSPYQPGELSEGRQRCNIRTCDQVSSNK